MTVILAKLQALLFQSGIGLKIVSLHSNKHQATKEVHIATGEFSEFNLGGITECYNTLTDSSQRGKTSDCLLNILRMLRCVVWGVRCEVLWWRWSTHYWHSPRLLPPLPVSSDGPNWTFPLQLSPACVSESSKCYTYNLQPTAYSLQPTSSIALATSEEIRRLLLVNNIKYEFSSQI